MIIYSRTNSEHSEDTQNFSYKTRGRKTLKSIKRAAVGASTQSTNKLKSLQKKNIQFLSKLGFEVKKS